ncbi:MAG TPA: hypothetical protein VJ323_20450, partial [Bryobacteraceae bacterium]|nr:hypothetical protein [Bryobacteraceae bacterium]
PKQTGKAVNRRRTHHDFIDTLSRRKARHAFNDAPAQHVNRATHASCFHPALRRLKCLPGPILTHGFGFPARQKAGHITRKKRLHVDQLNDRIATLLRSPNRFIDGLQ